MIIYLKLYIRTIYLFEKFLCYIGYHDLSILIDNNDNRCYCCIRCDKIFYEKNDDGVLRIRRE